MRSRRVLPEANARPEDEPSRLEPPQGNDVPARPQAYLEPKTVAQPRGLGRDWG